MRRTRTRTDSAPMSDRDHHTSDGAQWLSGEGPSSDVVLSSRVRLARNIAGFDFTARADETSRARLVELAERQLLNAHLADHMVWVNLAGLPPLERSLLVERHLISKQLARSDGPRGVAISSPDEQLAVMVNEEDHFRIQMMRSGLDVKGAFEAIDEVDDRIEAALDYSYAPRFGYLTACPTNVGTGIRVSVMLHLPALKLTGGMDKFHRAAKAMSLAVRGFYGEGSEATGDFYQVSNQTTLGKSEREIVGVFEQGIIPKLVQFERLARRELADKPTPAVQDRVFRALGTLRYARMLKSDEALQLLSLVRLGVVTAMLPGVDVASINRLTLLTQPAHLQKLVGRSLDQAERKVERASLVRSVLGSDAHE